jgi:[amino group carrier protein]-lysine/ornithine hydrolase
MFLDDVKFLKRVVEIPSIGDCSQLANFLSEQFTEWGIDNHIDSVGNVIATVGSGKTLLLTSHMDTVPGNIPVRIENGNLYGRGSVDAKSGLAAFAWLMKDLADSGLKVIFIGVVDEEGESKGARAILDKYKPDFVINGEPSGWDGITISYRGCIKFECEIKLEERHSSTQDSAPLLLNDFINKIRNYLGGSGPSFSSANLEVPNIEGNNHRARMRLMVRTPAEFNIEDFQGFIESNKEDINVNFLEETPAVLAGKNNELVRALIAGIREEGEPVFKRKTGTSDMNLFAQWNCPIVSYAAGDSKLDHTPNEHLNIEEWRRSLRILRSAIRSLVNNISDGNKE